MSAHEPVVVIGAGLVGPVLALYLARRGHEVQVVDRRPDPRRDGVGGGRSVNIVISERGWSVLAELELAHGVRELCRPLRGRTVHPLGGELGLQPYGRHGQTIWCIERPVLNRFLLDALEREPGIGVRFGRRCVDVDLETRRVAFERPGSRDRDWEGCSRVLAADGAFSGARSTLLYERFNYSQSYLEMGYKEIRLRAGAEGGPPLALDTFHVWPRGRFLLGAFPNRDDSFTGSLFLRHEGECSFRTLAEPGALAALVRTELPDLEAWLPEIEEQFHAHPVADLVTIRARPWVWGDFLALVGDAAHAILPFFGQGMNCGFEDARCLVRELDAASDDWKVALARYEAARRPNADAIAELSLEHYHQLSGASPSPEDPLKASVEAAMYRWYPDRFAPLYETIAFSQLPYAEARDRERDRQRCLRRILSTPGVAQRWGQQSAQLVRQVVEGPDDSQLRIPVYFAMLEEAWAEGGVTSEEEDMLERLGKLLGLSDDVMRSARDVWLTDRSLGESQPEFDPAATARSQGLTGEFELETQTMLEISALGFEELED